MSETLQVGLLDYDKNLPSPAFNGHFPHESHEEEITSATLKPLPKYLAAGLTDALSDYSIGDAEAAHLRRHQIDAVSSFQNNVSEIIDGSRPNQGMAILHPTGSGKTVTAAELVRMLCIKERRPLRTLLLVPGHQILRQTTGNEDEVGAIQSFVPNVSVAEYSGKRKVLGANVTVMTYQALQGAASRGDLKKIDPSLIICDEAHHIIDGTWASEVERAAQGRLLLGLTATPVFSATRNVRRLFPVVLDRKTMREGIDEGILSGLRGFLYKGESSLSIARFGADYDEEALFNALIESNDNYLAAKICAQEVSQGRRGVVSCVPGFDRAHAKVMAQILSQTKIKTPDGNERFIKAEFVGGEIHEKQLARIFKAYKDGKVDVITYVNLLLEGWDSPQSDFTVLLRPTMSRVLAEQRIGRIVRPRQGKTATVHEIVYEFDESSPIQVTHMDVMEQGESGVIQGYYYGNHKGERIRQTKKRYDKGGPKHIFDSDDYIVDPELSSKLAELDGIPLQELLISCGQESIPFEWLTSYVLAGRFDMTVEGVEAVLAEHQVLSRAEETNGIERTYFPPRAMEILSAHLGLKSMPEGFLTLTDIVEYHRDFIQFRRVSRKIVEAALLEDGIKPKLYLTERGHVVRAFPPKALGTKPVSSRVEMTANSEASKKVRGEYQPPEDAATQTEHVVEWLNQILIIPDSSATNYERRMITTAQNCLLAAIEKLGPIPAPMYRKIELELKKTQIDMSPNIGNVMRTKKLDLVALIVAAAQARIYLANINKVKGESDS